MAFQTPGTPAINLPAYKTPTFTLPQTLSNSPLTSVTFTGTAANAPFTFGQIFKAGVLAPSDGLVGRISGISDMPLQVDVKATHSDGSVRHAIISGASAALGEMHILRTAKTDSGNTIKSDTTFKVVIVASGVEYTAVSKFSGDVWLTGNFAEEHVSFEPLVTVDGVVHPQLSVQFAERVYSTGNTKVDVVVENVKAYSAQTDVTYDVKMYAGDVVMYEKTALVHFPCTRYKKTLWSKGKPNLNIQHNSAYLVSAKAVSNYDLSIKVPETVLSGYVSMLATPSFEPMKSGRFATAMGMAGGRAEIGLAPDSYVVFLITQDQRAKDMMLASADAAGSFSAHRRDPTGAQLNVINYQNSTLYGTPGDSYNPLTGQREVLPGPTSTSPLSLDNAHQPAFAYLPYLVTGDYYYLEELNFWNNWNLYSENPGYRKQHQGLVCRFQLRGQGWSIRTMAEAAYINPDSYALKSAAIHWLDSNLKFFNTNYTDGNNNKLGIITNGYAVTYGSAGGVNTATAPWQDDFFTQGVGRAAELGFSEAARLLKWKAQFQIGRLIAPGYCFTDAAVYSLRVRESATTPFYETLAECHKNSFGADYEGLTCNSPERVALMNSKTGNRYVLDEIHGYATTPEGYPSNLQPALAMAVDSGYEGGAAAWQLFINRSVKPSYNSKPQFAILPRSLADVVVTPPIEVPPVIVPPVVIPPVIVAPPVVETPVLKVVFNNPALVNLNNLTVMLSNGILTKVFQNQIGSADGTVVIDTKDLAVGASWTTTVLNELGMTISSIFPVKVI